MSNAQTFAGSRLDEILERMAALGMQSTAQGLSTLLGRPIRMAAPSLEVVPIWEVADRVGGPEQPAVGIYLMVSGDLPGHVMLIMPLSSAFQLVDMLMEVPEGTTKELGAMERSALGEVGNISASLFLNAVADAAGMDARPSPPAVMIDMVGAILNVILVSAGALSDDVLLLETEFHGPDRSVSLYFWLVPDPSLVAGAE